MASQGPLYPGTVSTEVGPSGDDAWVSPSSVGADDGTRATITAATFDNADHSHRLRATGFGFSIPAGATIDGIIVEIDREIDAGSARDQEVRLLDAAGALVGTDKATATAWPASLAIATYGGATDTWAAGLTAADINDPDFGVALIAAATAANTDIAVDFIRVTVHYTEAGVTVTPSTSSLTLTTFAPAVTTGGGGGGGGLTFTDYFAKADIGALTDPTFSVTGVEWSEGDLIAVIYSGRDDGATTSSCTNTGTPETFTPREHLNDPQTQTYGGIWTAKAENDSGGPQTVTIQIIEDNIAAGGGIGMLVRVWHGSDPQYDASSTSDNGGVDTNSPSIDLTTIAAATSWLAIIQSRNRTITTPPAGMTPANGPVNGGAAADIVAQQAGTSGGIAGFSAYGKAETTAGVKTASAVLSNITEWLMLAISVTDAGGGGTGTTVTPATATLSLATFAPTVSTSSHQLVTPAPASLTTARFAPVLRLGLTPATAALVTARFAPQLRLGLTVPAPGLNLSSFAPTVTATAHQLVTPPAAALATARFAPTVATSDHKLVTPSTSSLTLTTFAPTVTAAAGLTLVPAPAGLTLTAFAPSASVTAHQTLTPGTRALTLATFAPTVTATAHQLVTPPAAALATARFAPTVSASGHRVVTPTAAVLTITTFAPNVQAGAGLTVVPGVRALALATFAPTVTATAHRVATPATVALILAGLPPLVTSSDHRLVTPPPAGLVTTALNPAVTASDHQRVTVALAALAVAGLPPDVAVVLLPSVFYGDPPYITGSTIGPRITGSTTGAPRITEASVVAPVIVEVEP